MNILRLAALIVAAGLIAAPAWAASVGNFYHGKQVTLLIGSPPGGGYDIYSRTIGRHIGDSIPGHPSIVVKNMPGSGSVKMSNYLYNQAPKDGTVLGLPQNGVAFEPLFHLLSPGGRTARFDGTRFNWIGSANRGVFILFAWHDAKVKTFSDLQDTELLVGSSGANTDNSILAQVLNRVFHTKLKVVTGYKGGNGIYLAIERGEVQGAAGTSYAGLKTREPDWFRDHKINVLVQMGLTPDPEIKDVPFALDLAKNADDRRVMEVIFAKYRMARPMFAPPGLPRDRIALLRKAFMDMTRDPKFLADAGKQRLDINPVSGQEVQALVERIYDTPEPLLARVRDVLGTR